MIVPVIWPARHEKYRARGYADQALLEAILSRELWRPPDAITFEHHEVRDRFPDVPGALVIANGRANVDDANWLIQSIERLEWSVVILTGDEEWVFPWARVVENETRRLWIMAPEPYHADVSYRIPGGWYWNTRDDLRAAYEAEGHHRDLDWFFAGQVTNQRREQCAEVLRDLPRGHLLETEGFLQGMSAPEYARHLVRAKVVPCPSGPTQVDTARPLSALEAGCVPVVDLVRPNNLPQFDYWELVFPGYPWSGVTNWGTFPGTLSRLVASWPHEANRCSAYWQQWKRRTAHKLDADLRAVSGQAKAPETPDDLVTVIVTTSPAPLHPSTEHIEQCIASIRAQLPDCEVVIVADGVRPEQVDRQGDYDEYLRRLLWLCNWEWHNVVPVLMDEWVHQANATRAALDLVTTPLVLFMEHDTTLVGEIDWPVLCEFVQSGEANCVRFLETVATEPEHAAIYIGDPVRRGERGHRVYREAVGDDYVFDQFPIHVQRTVAWWQRPHLSRADFYRERIMPMFSPESRTMIEEVVYAVVETQYQERGEPAWWDWRLWIYAPPGDMRRHHHLDSRGADPKYPMHYVYDGGTPRGAPEPTGYPT